MTARFTHFIVGAAGALVIGHSVATAQTTFSVVHSFPSPGAVRPYSPLLRAADGDFYGTTLNGGAADRGVFFKMTPTGTFTVLHDFAGGSTDGANPRGAIVQAGDGNFYGTTQQGGAGDIGTIYKTTPAGVVTVLHAFSGSVSDGYYPYGGLALGTDGLLYGTTVYGGLGGGVGTTFKITTSGTFTSLHTFMTSDGAYPYATLVQATDSNFYGVTYFGGSLNRGTLFRMTPTGTITTLHNFTGGDDGSFPQGTLIQATDTLLWGTTNGGGQNVGVAFKSTLGGTFTTVHQFLGTVDGDSSVAPLLQGPDGNFYGTTLYGGSPQCGSVFQLTPGGTVTLLHGFTCAVDGAFPFFGVTLAADGSYYGMTHKGGPSNAGTIYKVTSGGTFTLLRSLTGSTDGAKPRASLISAGANFYGTTLVGGPTDLGTAFKMSSVGAVTLLHAFADLGDGLTPSGLVQATDGNFYGAAAASTSIFSPAEGSVMFRLTPTGTYTALKVLSYSADGDDPNTMIQAADGNLYGTCRTGGTANNGTVFVMTPGGTFTVLHAFAGGASDGSTPQSALVQATDGNFYGTTRFGGTSNKGTLFRITPGGTFTLLHSFRGYTVGGDGDEPYAPVIQAADGNLYGTTIHGGVEDFGAVFRTNLAGSTFAIVHSFLGTGAEGKSLFAPLVEVSTGLFYGTASAGGASGVGTIYQMNTAGTLTVLHNFNTTNGSTPYAGLLRTTGTTVYGTTLAGGPSGANGMGVIFRLGPPPAAFTDDPLVAGSTKVKAIHITELRTRIDTQRTRFGLSPFAWMDPTLSVGTTPVKAVHITQLRQALTETYVSAGLSSPTYTDTIVAGATVVKAVHISELRSLVQAIE